MSRTVEELKAPGVLGTWEYRVVLGRNHGVPIVSQVMGAATVEKVFARELATATDVDEATSVMLERRFVSDWTIERVADPRREGMPAPAAGAGDEFDLVGPGAGPAHMPGA